jgi:hypothetical protein
MIQLHVVPPNVIEALMMDAAITAAYLSAAVAVIAAVVAYVQVIVARRSAQAELLREAMRELNDEKFRIARRLVYATEGKPVEEWSPEEVAAANQVGPVYSELGFLAKHGFLQRTEFIRHFGGQFVRAYVRLEPFVLQERRRLTSTTQWIYFEWLARESYLEIVVRDQLDWWQSPQWRSLQERTGSMEDYRRRDAKA